MIKAQILALLDLKLHQRCCLHRASLACYTESSGHTVLARSSGGEAFDTQPGAGARELTLHLHCIACLRAQSVQKHTLTPHWDEDLYVMVQEPKTQNLRVQMFDRDLLNVKARPAFHGLSARV